MRNEQGVPFDEKDDMATTELCPVKSLQLMQVIRSDTFHGNQMFFQPNKSTLQVVKAMRDCVKQTGQGELSFAFSADFTVDDPNELIDRGKYILPWFGPL